MSKGIPEVGLLNSDYDFYQWITRMEDLLVYKELVDYVYQDGSMLTDATEKLRDRKALSLVRSHVAPTLLPYLQGLSSAKAAWDMLHQLYATSLGARKSLLEDRLSSFEKADDKDMEAYVGRGQKLRIELVASGESVSEERLIQAILRGSRQVDASNLPAGSATSDSNAFLLGCSGTQANYREWIS